MKNTLKTVLAALCLVLVTSAAQAGGKFLPQLDESLQKLKGDAGNSQCEQAKWAVKSALKPLTKTTGKTMGLNPTLASNVRLAANDAFQKIEGATTTAEVIGYWDYFQDYASSYIDLDYLTGRYVYAYNSLPTTVYYPHCSGVTGVCNTYGYNGYTTNLGCLANSIFDLNNLNNRLQGWMDRRKATFWNNYWAGQSARATFNGFSGWYNGGLVSYWYPSCTTVSCAQPAVGTVSLDRTLLLPSTTVWPSTYLW